jgi:glycosyltransferase involved in cell wall biosynthesis
LNGGSAETVFSVVVPTLGRARQLEGCLDALARLDYPRLRFEVVVVNDGGGDAIDQAASGWEDQLNLELITTEAVGPSGARNAGARRARGRFVVFTDDDCEPEAGWLRALEPVLEVNPDSAIGGTIVNGARGRWAAASQAMLDATHAHFNRDPAEPRFFATNNLAFPADGLRAVGGFDESFRYAEDRELCERWLHSGRHFGHAPKAIVRHMRELTPRGFWRQHFGYGRGAWALHRVRSERDWGRFEIEPHFYAELGRQIRRPRNGVGPLFLGASAVISQLANAAGFAHEGLSARRRARPKAAPLEEVSR